MILYVLFRTIRKSIFSYFCCTFRNDFWGSTRISKKGGPSSPLEGWWRQMFSGRLASGNTRLFGANLLKIVDFSKGNLKIWGSFSKKMLEDLEIFCYYWKNWNWRTFRIWSFFCLPGEGNQVIRRGNVVTVEDPMLYFTHNAPRKFPQWRLTLQNG